MEGVHTRARPEEIFVERVKSKRVLIHPQMLPRAVYFGFASNPSPAPSCGSFSSPDEFNPPAPLQWHGDRRLDEDENHESSQQKKQIQKKAKLA